MTPPVHPGGGATVRRRFDEGTAVRERLGRVAPDASGGGSTGGGSAGDGLTGLTRPGGGVVPASSWRSGRDRPGRAPDLRLVAVALATWLSAYALRYGRVSWAVATAVAAGIAAGWLWRRRPRVGWAGVALAVLLGVVCGGTATGARLAARDAEAVAGPARARAVVTVELTIRSDPRALRRDPGQAPSWLVPAWLDRLRPVDGDRSTRVRARVLVFTGHEQWRELGPGQRVRATGRLGPPRGGDLTAAVLSVTQPPEPLGEPPWPLRAASSLRAGLQAASRPLPDDVAGLVPALAVGDVSELDPALSDDFFVTGMTHLVAVSGTHVAIVTGAVFLLARAVRVPPWLTAVVSGAAVLGYVVLCQASPSVLRAGVMGLIALVALASGRPRATLPALAAAVVLLVVLDPDLAGSVGFTLSVLATAGLLLLAPRWRDALRRRGVPKGWAEALAVPAAAQLAVSPVIAGMSGTVSLVAVVANLVATPVIVPATLLGALAAVASPVSPRLAEFLAWLASWPAWWLVLVARYGARVPAAVVAWPTGAGGALLLAALSIGLLLVMRHRRVRTVLVVSALAALVGVVAVRGFASGWPPPGTVVVACAVGQGDLLVLPVGPGQAVVVDAGPAPAAADRCLRDLRIRSVPLLVISHFHADHVGGAAGVFRGRRVAAVLTSPLTEPEDGYTLLLTLAERRGAVVRPAYAGDSFQVGEVRLTVLGPREPLTGTRSDPNNNSLVVRAEARGVSVLLTGDAETELQQRLLAQVGAGPLRADVLKVAHHGSAYQDPGFLAAVSPRVALVPVGAGNRYGHPDPALLSDLAGRGTRILRTDLGEDVAAVATGPGRLAVVSRPLPPGTSRPP